MSNWLADPTTCAVRLKTQHGCTVLAGREEAMSRTTRVLRTETANGSRYEAGSLFVRTVGKPGQQRNMYAGNGARIDELGPLSPTQANEMSDLLRAAYANAGGESCGGKSLYDMVWDELMTITDRLMSGNAAEDDVGAARATAYIIALMQNPYRPNVETVKEQAMDKWEEENTDA